MHAPRLPFDSSAAFVARTDFAHGSAEYKAGASFDRDGLTAFDLATLWRTSLIDVAPPAMAPAVAGPASAAPRPTKSTKPPRAAARS